MVLGCTPSPKEVCEKLLAARRTAAAGSQRGRAMASCLSEQTRLRAKNEESYRCRAKCVTAAATSDEIDGCLRLCGKVDEEGDIAGGDDGAAGSTAASASSAKAASSGSGKGEKAAGKREK